MLILFVCKYGTFSQSKMLVYDINFKHIGAVPALFGRVTYRLPSTCEWLKRKQNIIITGATGVGKSFLASALAEKACRSGFQARYFRYQSLLSELTFSVADGSFKNYLLKLEKLNLIVIDDWALHSITEIEQKYLFELIEARSENSSTIFVSQTPIASWHSLMPNSTIADAILDRIVHTAIRIELKGESMRKKSDHKIDEETAIMK